MNYAYNKNDDEIRERVMVKLNNMYRELPSEVRFFCNIDGGSWSITAQRERKSAIKKQA